MKKRHWKRHILIIIAILVLMGYVAVKTGLISRVTDIEYDPEILEEAGEWKGFPFAYINDNVPEFGDRFFDISDLYCKELRQIAEQCGEDSGLTIHEGVYFFFPGPQFETPAEVRAARILGGDAVGMSTVTETLTAGHCGMPVLGLSLMTNMAAGVLEQKLSGEEVEETAQRVAPLLEAYFAKVLKALPHYEE